MTSKVYLVGAGCGSLDLYTQKAIALIKQADCLVYDDLIDREVLNLVKQECKKIYVGKRAYFHGMQQDQINRLLVDLAGQYQLIVRLKGGDVYVFGRGGEEGQTLYEHDIDFEVVPGLSSVTAGLAYAGIPVTHRGMSKGFQVFPGRLQHDSDDLFDFSKMLDDEVTYIFLMAIAKIDLIVNGLLKAGKKPQTKIAIISHASFPTQQVLTGTLDDIIIKYRQQPLPTPGIIVVGEVVSMRQYLNFYERLPLFKTKILVTTVGNDHFLSKRLKQLGADVKEVPTGQITYLNPKIEITPAYLIFTSKHGVIGFMSAYLKQHHDLRKLALVKIVAIGTKTNQCLNRYGLTADLIADKANSYSLEQLIKTKCHDLPVILVKGKQKPTIDCFDAALEVYHNESIAIDDNDNVYDFGLFTCASSVERFATNNKSTIKQFVSIGPMTSRMIEKIYHQLPLETKTTNKEEMIELVLRGYQ